MKKFIKTLACGGLVLSFSTLALANDAGCGLGSLVIQKNSKLSQSAALTTNNLTLTNFFGITSGTSNCGASEFVKVNNKDAAKYAEANFQNLQVEMARGKGENLSALAQLLGCNDASIPAFGQLTRSKYQNIFPSSEVNPVQMLNSVDQAVHSDSQLSKVCTKAS
jgi:hypothetical protein